MQYQVSQKLGGPPEEAVSASAMALKLIQDQFLNETSYEELSHLVDEKLFLGALESLLDCTTS